MDGELYHAGMKWQLVCEPLFLLSRRVRVKPVSPRLKHATLSSLDPRTICPKTCDLSGAIPLNSTFSDQPAFCGRAVKPYLLRRYLLLGRSVLSAQKTSITLDSDLWRQVRA